MKPLRTVLLVSLIFLITMPIISAGEIPRDFLIEVSKGNVPGHIIERLAGINPSVGIDYEDITSHGGNYVYPVAAVFLNVSSTDVDDTSGGTGAWNVTIEGLDVNWNRINETVQMDGQNNVTTVEEYIRVNHVYTREAGSSEWNEGTISITSGSNILSTIIPTHGEDQQALFSVPANFSLLPFSAIVTSSEDKTVKVELQTRLFEESWHTTIELFSFRSNTIFDVKGFRLIPGRTDIKIRGLVGATTGEIGAVFNFVLINDSVLHNSTLNWSNGDSGGVIISQPVQVNIVESIDLMTAEFVVFTMIAAILTYLGSTSPVPGDRMMRFGVAFIFWIATLSQWITDGGGFVPLLALTAPTLMSLIWAIQAMSEVTETPVKKDIYSVYN